MHGLAILSEFPLGHGRTTTAPPDLTVSRGADRASTAELPAGIVLARVDAPEGGPFYTLVQTPDGYLLRCHGICDIYLDLDLTTVVCCVDPNGAPQILPVIISGTLLSMVLCLRGVLVLHASAVDVGGRAIAFIGESGMGKSTLATWMCTGQGALLVTDDVLRVDVGTPTTCRLGATESRLRPGAASLISSFEPGTSRQTPDERTALAVPPASTDPLPLRAILVPQPDRAAQDVEVKWLAPADAMLALSRFPRILGWESPQVLGEQFAALGELVKRVPIGVMTVPWGPPFDSQVPASLVQELDRYEGRLTAPGNEAGHALPSPGEPV